MTPTNMSRRDMVKIAAGLGAISLPFATTGRVAQARETVATPTSGLVTIHKLGPVVLHTYTAPEASALVNTHIVETPNALYMIDAQFVQRFASEVRAYADSLGKPIEALYLSHYHPDLLLGASQFADVTFVTTEAVLADVMANQTMYAQRKEKLGDATALSLPDGGLTVGETQWDGIAVDIAEVKDAEAPHTLTFHIPAAGLFIAQDLLYAHAHAFPLGNGPNWINALADVRIKEGLKVIAPGHGLPASPGAVDDAIAYLTFQQDVLERSESAQDAIDDILEAYPGYGGKDLLSFVSFRF